MGRHRKEVDLEKVENMASFACTQEEIALECGFERTLFHSRRDVREAYTNGFNKAKTRLRVAQFKAATAGNTTMMIWLGRQYLGQKESFDAEIKAEDKVTVVIDV